MQSTDEQTMTSPDESNGSDGLSADDIENENSLILFHDGEYMSLDDAALITAENPTQVIVLAGPSASGKTTLLAGIFEKFSNQEMKKFLFAGSQTLPGF